MIGRMLFYWIPLVVSLACKPRIEATGANTLVNNGVKISNPEDLVALSTVALCDNELSCFCSGTLITPRHVATAAHCVRGKTPGWIRIETLAVRNAGTGIRTFSHALYNGPEVKVANDVAIVELEQNVPGSLKPVAILKKGILPSFTPWTKILIAGFGANSRDKSEKNYRNEVYGELHSGEVALPRGFMDGDSDRFVFDNPQNAVGCDADSGGPLYIKESNTKLVLIGSLATGNEACLFSNKYVNLRHYRHWVECAISYSFDGGRFLNKDEYKRMCPSGKENVIVLDH